VVHPTAELYGSDRMLLESVRALTPQWDVRVIVADTGPLQQACRSAGAAVATLPFPVLRKTALHPRGLLRLIGQLLIGLHTGGWMRMVRDADVVYVNTITVPVWLLLARLAGVPAVCHVHEAEESAPAVIRRALTLPLRLTRLVVANSTAARDVLVASDRRLAGRIEVLHNGVPGPPRPVAPVRHRLSGGLRLLLVGRISRRKGSDVAVEALGVLARRGLRVRLTLAGDVFAGYEPFARQLEERVAALGLADRVSFTGFVKDVWSLHEEADIVVVPSRCEPFGNVAVEAMLAGRPVIASAVQGLKEIVQDGVTGLLVPADDVHALADAVQRLEEDWLLAQTLASSGQSRARERFGVDRYAERLRDLVTGLATGADMQVAG
jgi:glycosyltransferase involved in cell wall biosynthesis